MVVTPLGIVIETRLLQPEKVFLGIDVTWLLKVTEVKELQPKKMSSSIVVTLSSMVTEIKSLQLVKACSPIEVTLYVAPSYSTDFGMTILPTYLSVFSKYDYPI